MAMPSATAQPVLPDELLEDILLRLDDAADLARASATCASFHRVVTDRRFLRRFRSLHSPPVLGLLLDSSDGSRKGFYPAQPPCRSAPAARAFAAAADFTFSFLSDPARWHVRDICDGRVLLARRLELPRASWFVFDKLVVYDPLHRRHVEIPPVPGDLAPNAWQREYEPFLVPVGEEKESSLRVICNVVYENKFVTLVFSSLDGEWRDVTCFSTATFELMRYSILLNRHYAHGCFYWTDYAQKVMLMLDMRDMKLSVVDLPDESEGQQKTIVEAGKDKLGLLILNRRMLDLYIKTCQDNSVGIEEWQHDNTILLTQLPDCVWGIDSEAEGYIVLRGLPRDELDAWMFPDEKPDVLYVTIDVKTLLIERLCVLKFETWPVYLYARFLPPLPLPSI
ncbi:hypothetical protein ACP70R_033323 [Stipagrostis hirtigluma subsp. patula]